MIAPRKREKFKLRLDFQFRSFVSSKSWTHHAEHRSSTMWKLQNWFLNTKFLLPHFVTCRNSDRFLREWKHWFARFGCRKISSNKRWETWRMLKVRSRARALFELKITDNNSHRICDVFMSRPEGFIQKYVSVPLKPLDNEKNHNPKQLTRFGKKSRTTRH